MGSVMGSQLELYQARLSHIEDTDSLLALHFSFAHIHKTVGKPWRDTEEGWSQEVILLLERPQSIKHLPELPNSVADGYIETDGTRFELIPVPFQHDGPCLLHLEFIDGTMLDVYAYNPMIRLEGDKVKLDSY